MLSHPCHSLKSTYFNPVFKPWNIELWSTYFDLKNGCSGFVTILFRSIEWAGRTGPITLGRLPHGAARRPVLPAVVLAAGEVDNALEQHRSGRAHRPLQDHCLRVARVLGLWGDAQEFLRRHQGQREVRNVDRVFTEFFIRVERTLEASLNFDTAEFHSRFDRLKQPEGLWFSEYFLWWISCV